MRKYHKNVEVEGIRYRFTAEEGGPVSFYITGGGTKQKTFKSHFWHDDRDDLAVSDYNFQIAAMKVFMRMKPVLLEWVYTHKPYAFHFEATTSRKYKIYKWISSRLAKQLSDCYVMNESGKGFYFNRKENDDKCE